MIKENILYYIWQFKKFNLLDLKTITGEKIEIINSGYYNPNEGPDFSNAKIKVDNLIWNGSGDTCKII